MSNFSKYPSLTDKSVFVSGGASGIGASFVDQFSKQGAKVAFLDTDQRSGEELVGRLTGAPHRPAFVLCDVTDLSALDREVKVVRQQNGPIQILINNAASDVRHEIGDTTPEIFDRNISVNLRHQYFAIQAVLPDMRQLGGGSIICLCSTGWMRFIKDYPLYATSKAAIAGLVRGLTRTLGPEPHPYKSPRAWLGDYREAAPVVAQGQRPSIRRPWSGAARLPFARGNRPRCPVSCF